MSIAKQAPEYIRAISPYIPGKPMTQLAREMGIPVDKIVKLASNENPLGMSPRARVAVEQAIAGIERYPDQFDLIKALADRTGWRRSRSCWATAPMTSSIWRHAFFSPPVVRR